MASVGVKGSDVYTADDVENPLVALSVLLTRGVNANVVQTAVHTIIDSLSAYSANPVIEDLLVLAFQTRDIRGGKGERDASAHMFDALLNNIHTCDLTLDLLDLVPEYGCWRDLLMNKSYHSIRRILAIVEKQFAADEAALAAGKPVSLLAKWMPREGQVGAELLASRLLKPTTSESIPRNSRMRLYRKRVAALNRAINTVEIKMCARQWDAIEPAKVPGRAMKKYTKAFLNELGTTRKGQKVASGALRHPSDQVRMLCREHFQAYFAKAATGEVKAKGADTIFPHEVVKKACELLETDHGEGCACCYRQGDPAQDEKNMLRGVWKSMVEEAKAGGGLGRSLAMCDFSGSMRCSDSNGDTPFWVSMAIGLLISEVTTQEFKNTFLTFDSTPQMHVLAEGDLFQKLNSIDHNSISQGTSTDFQKAMDLVLAQLKAKRVKAGEEPENLIVLTDMAWDQACGSDTQSPYTGHFYRHNVKTAPWQTHIEMIRESFKRAGEDMWGEGNGWKMPRIVIWNIAATCQDFHAKADTEGVVMLSGWSPSMFKVLQKDGVTVQTPLAALRAQIDVERYLAVRQRVRKFYENTHKEFYDYAAA